MTRIAVAVLLLACVASAPSLAQKAQSSAAAAPAPASASADNKQSAERKLVYQAVDLLGKGAADQALERIDRAIAGYETRFSGSRQQIYSAREMTETLLYMGEAASGNKDAIAVEPEYGYAHYFRGYALVELGRHDEALPSLQKAVSLSPYNAQFMAELGNWYQDRKDWPNALSYYERAQGASEFSPEDLKKSELSRALRGIGFVYIEQRKLDEAEAIYKRCLELDPEDKTAQNELEYVRQLRGQTKA